jgi:hypothetical protein
MPRNLSIIITHYKTPELLDLCIKSIKENIGNLDHEIIVVDSESKEETREFIKEKYPEIKIIPFEKNLGYSKIVNTGIKSAVGKYILILNADIIVLENAISELLGYLENNPQAGIVGPQLLDFTNNIQDSCFSNPTIPAILSRRTFLGKTKWGKAALEKFTIENQNGKSAREIDWVQGSAMMVRKKAIDEVGLWDEKFFMYFEDADWCRRFWQKGLKVIYLPSAKMVHYYHRSSKRFGAILDAIFNKQTRIHIISAIKYFIKYKK